MSDSRPDLSKIIRQPGPPRTGGRRAAWLLPTAIATGFACVFLLLFRDRLIPAKAVEITIALAIPAPQASGNNDSPDSHTAPTRAPQTGSSGKLLFQASGWIEPDPQPVKVTALTDGFVNTVNALEGAIVKKGDLIATLIDADTRLARDAAAADVTMREAELAALANSAKATEHKLAAERAGLLAAEADASEAADRLARLERTRGDAVPETERISAKLENSRRQAAVRVRQAMIRQSEEEHAGIQQESAAMTARLTAAKVQLAQADLNLSRTRITAPFDGRILRLMAAPGQKKMAAMDDVDSSTIAILYDPAKLQVRVDVPLADASGLSVGGPVRIRCNLLPNQPFDGIVTRINGEADLQRNTLQAKVRILNPADQLRPEMLCRAEFLEPAAAASAVGRQPSSPPSSTGPLAVFVPESSIDGAAVWICDPESSRVSSRPIVATAETRDGRRRLESGVRPGEWVVRNPVGLREGQRVKPVQVP
ncbi:MAG: efflux RND transporter periplasmic adaptor subunit [Verrucomicrobia bacterium]|nr:efflux RND transporter periplasmic adaptor subunit [Verrucomicrobiota bacterium]